MDTSLDDATMHQPHVESGEAITVRELQAQLASMQARLDQAQRMTALGELLGTTTHEFNNVLMSIINYAKLGLRHRDDATRDKSLQKILAASERAAQITNCVLGMARNRSNRMSPTDLPALIEETLVLLEREMNKYRVSVECDFAEVPKVHANGNQIQQVLINLMTNARQAMPKGGRLTIGVSNDVEGGYVELRVRDTGDGIPQAKLRKIFDPYFSTKDGPDATGKGGTGLGLSACRSIIEDHRGRIRVQSAVGKGTAFTIMLPASKDQKSAAKKLVT